MRRTSYYRDVDQPSPISPKHAVCEMTTALPQHWEDCMAMAQLFSRSQILKPTPPDANDTRTPEQRHHDEEWIRSFDPELDVRPLNTNCNSAISPAELVRKARAAGWDLDLNK